VSTLHVIAPPCYTGILHVDVSPNSADCAGGKRAGPVTKRALETGTGKGTGAGQGAVPANSPMVGIIRIPGPIPGTPDLLEMTDTGTAGGPQTTGTGAGLVPNGLALMTGTTIPSMLRVLWYPLTMRGAHVTTDKSRMWMGNGSSLRTLVRLFFLQCPWIACQKCLPNSAW